MSQLPPRLYQATEQAADHLAAIAAASGVRLTKPNGALTTAGVQLLYLLRERLAEAEERAGLPATDEDI